MTDVIKNIEENVEEGLEDLEEVSEEVEEILTGEALEKKAKKESTDAEKELEAKKKKLLEKAAKLKEKVASESPTSEELKEQVKAKKRAEMLIPLDDYVKAGIYIGTRVVTPDMRPFVYRRRADGLAIFNTDLIDEKLKEGIEYLSKFNPEDIVLICKRQAGWKPAKMFSEITGIRVFTKKYPAGILTNTQLNDFFENELTVITDHWLDKNALEDTLRVKKNVLMVCDTNNFSKGANQIIIGNNKSPRSLGLIFYLLTKGYIKAKGIEKNIPDLEYWTGEVDEVQKSSRPRAKVQFGV
jgi:small subunit ribosomal protein S2